MENLKIELKKELDEDSKKLAEDIGGIAGFLIGASDKIQSKRIDEFNNKLDECNYTEKEIIEKLHNLCKAYFKAKSINDSMQVWVAIPKVNDPDDVVNECLMALNVYEAPAIKDCFNTIDVMHDGELTNSLKEITFGGELYLPDEPTCSWYLTEPQIFIDNLYIEINGIEKTLEEVETYVNLDSKFRLSQEEIQNASVNKIKEHLTSGGVVFDLEIKIEKSKDATFENLIEFMEDPSSHSYLNKNLYTIKEDEDNLYLITDKRVIDNPEIKEDFIVEINMALNLDFLRCERKEIITNKKVENSTKNKL